MPASGMLAAPTCAPAPVPQGNPAHHGRSARAFLPAGTKTARVPGAHSARRLGPVAGAAPQPARGSSRVPPQPRGPGRPRRPAPVRPGRGAAPAHCAGSRRQHRSHFLPPCPSGSGVSGCRSGGTGANKVLFGEGEAARPLQVGPARGARPSRPPPPGVGARCHLRPRAPPARTRVAGAPRSGSGSAAERPARRRERCWPGCRERGSPHGTPGTPSHRRGCRTRLRGGNGTRRGRGAVRPGWAGRAGRRPGALPAAEAQVATGRERGRARRRRCRGRRETCRKQWDFLLRQGCRCSGLPGRRKWVCGDGALLSSLCFGGDC